MAVARSVDRTAPSLRALPPVVGLELDRALSFDCDVLPESELLAPEPLTPARRAAEPRAVALPEDDGFPPGRDFPPEFDFLFELDFPIPGRLLDDFAPEDPGRRPLRSAADFSAIFTPTN